MAGQADINRCNIGEIFDRRDISPGCRAGDRHSAAGQNVAEVSSEPTSWVLVVEDHEMLRGELAAALEVSGFQVTAVAGADAALHALATHPEITVVLTDVRMPGRSGLALAREVLAGQSARSAVEVVLLSGHAAPEEAVAALRAGTVEFLRKPARLADITAVVVRAMRRAQARRGQARAAEQH